jgi:hypothetical protein
MLKLVQEAIQYARKCADTGQNQHAGQALMDAIYFLLASDIPELDGPSISALVEVLVLDAIRYGSHEALVWISLESAKFNIIHKTKPSLRYEYMSFSIGCRRLKENIAFQYVTAWDHMTCLVPHAPVRRHVVYISPHTECMFSKYQSLEELIGHLIVLF